MVQFFSYDTVYNLDLLTNQLRAAFPSAGTDIGVSSGDTDTTFTVNCPDDILEVDVATVVTNHNPALLTPEQAIAAVESGASTQASNIPGWATWDEATALNWFDTNIGANLPVANLSEANAVLSDMATLQRNLVRLVIALRNKNFPNLQE